MVQVEWGVAGEIVAPRYRGENWKVPKMTRQLLGIYYNTKLQHRRHFQLQADLTAVGVLHFATRDTYLTRHRNVGTYSNFGLTILESGRRPQNLSYAAKCYLNLKNK